jgi:serine/threonine protein kinase
MSTMEPGATLTSPDACSTLLFDDDYVLQKKLSKGSFGTVYAATHKSSGMEVAVKVIEKKNLAQKDVDAVHREVSILKDCKGVHNIIQLLDFYSSPLRYHVIQVMARGGDVFERLANRTSYNEKDARQLARRLLDERKLAHRDLKPENLLLKDLVDDSEILLADFGFAAYVPEGGLKTRCGMYYNNNDPVCNGWYLCLRYHG